MLPAMETKETAEMGTQTFAAALAKGALVFDGAMGTELYGRGMLYTSCFESLCDTQPELVASIHRSYLDAGARVLCANTFGANRIRLSSHGLEGRVEELNKKAIEVALGVAGDTAHVLACVGPTGVLLETADEEQHAAIEAAYLEQARAFAGTGVHGVLLETFRQPRELEIALRAVRNVLPSTMTVVASVSFDASGTTADGKGPEEVAGLLKAWGADAIGVNCADGPAGVYEMVIRMVGAGLPLVAQANAGLPQRVEGRFAYMATPDYFQLYARRLFKAGVAGVGGCCGTTPEHVRKIAASARMVAGGLTSLGAGGGMREVAGAELPIAPGVTPLATAEKGKIGALLGKKFIVSVEVNPPPGLSLDKAMAGARMLKDAGVDMINVADGPRASARMGNLALCLRVQRELDMPALMHVTTRDRNLLGLLSHLLAANELEVRNLVVITGDPPKMGDMPDATPVYDLDSIGLLRLIDGLNRGFDPGGKSMGAATSLLCATGAEPAAQDYERELERLKRKVHAGAEFIMTQPVYDIDVLDRFLKDIHPMGVPVLVGILPLASSRNAEFLHNEVPGMRVPDLIRERMRAAGKERGTAEGVQIAREMLSAVKERVAGAYIMPPFGRYRLAVDVISGIVR